MAFIWVNVSGNGTAYVDNPNPIAGDQVTLYAYADQGEQINDIYALDSGGHYIAMYVQPQQTFTYNSAWGDVSIYVEFSGTTPPTPTYNDIWIYWKMAKQKKKIH